LVREHIEQRRGKIALEYLPPYAPDLNLVECNWCYLKVSRDAEPLCPACWQQTELF
jgi:transposase